MKSIFISFDQAYYEQVQTVLTLNHVRGFSGWESVIGRGTKTGEPHYGTHAWPSLNTAIITVVEDEKVKPILDDLRTLDKTSERMGIRAFVWNIEDGM
ncbi:MAG: PG0541 family transporter-associated protein [Paludibacter sp.]|jgi:nitrogen regulatory protein PII